MRRSRGPGPDGQQASIFELIVPRILAGEKIERRDIVALGHGGFCENCESCRYPACGFGK